MSYTALIPFANGFPAKGTEFRNAWGGVARIWTALFDAYIPKKHPYDTWLGASKDERLWDLIHRRELAVFERSVHLFTFDLFYVRNEHFPRFSCDLRLFDKLHPANGGSVNHLPAWARWLDENPTVEAVGIYGTSVGDNLWYKHKECPCCGNQTDEREPVPLSSGFEVYDWLENNSARAATEASQ